MPPVQRKNHAHESINRVPAQRFVKRPARKLSNFRLIVQFSYRLDTVSDCQTFRVCAMLRIARNPKGLDAHCPKHFLNNCAQSMFGSRRRAV